MVVLLAGILEFFAADLRCVSYPASIMRRVVDWTEKKAVCGTGARFPTSMGRHRRRRVGLGGGI